MRRLLSRAPAKGPMPAHPGQCPCAEVQPLRRADGNTIVYIVVIMMLFAALGAAMVSIYSTAGLIAVIGDDSRQAGYLAESGIRYAVGALRKSYTRAVIRTLNDTAYTFGDGDTFDINVFPKWFLSAAGVAVTSGQNIDLNVPDNATIPDGYKISAGLYLVNIDGLRDAIAFGGDQSLFYAEVNADSVNVDADMLRVEVADAFQAGANQPVLLAVFPDTGTYGSETAIAVDGTGSLVIGGASQPAETAFHRGGGTFYVLNSVTGVRRIYAYEAYTVNSPVTLTGVRGLEPLSILASRDLIIFSDKNHTITAQGRTGPSGSQAIQRLEIDMPQNTASAPVLAPETAEETPADIDIDSFMEAAATPASTTGTVEIDDLNQEIRLGMNVLAASSAVWYGGTQNIGGVSGNFCSAGQCKFEYGMRAYFTLTYNGTGDGFTFALTNGQDNNLTSFGGKGQYLGYAGIGSGSSGIIPPKMAIEFDTFTNPAQYPPDRNDPGPNFKDFIQFVFWGDNETDLYDDNAHDLGDKQLLWSHLVNGDIRSKPIFDSNGKIIITDLSGRIYKINTTGGREATFYFSSAGKGSHSSPAIASDGSIYVGSDDGYLNKIRSEASSFSFMWFKPIGDYAVADIYTKPYLDSNGRIFLGTDYTGPTSETSCNFCAFYSNGSPIWGYNTTATIRSSAAGFGSSIFFGSNKDGGKLYKFPSSSNSPDWIFSTDSDVESSPAISDNGTIYVGSGINDKRFYAINPDGSLKWRYLTGDRVFSSPIIDESRRQVYVGSDDDKVYCFDMDTGTKKWDYQTGGDVRSSPEIGEDGKIYVGSDDGYLYAFEPDGILVWRMNIGSGNPVRSSPTINSAGNRLYIGDDNNYLHAVSIAGSPPNIKNKFITSETIQDEVAVTPPDWLNSGMWALRLEVERSKSDVSNDTGKYPYSIKAWIRQCADDPGDCSDITGSYFSDTRVSYAAKPAQMSQSFELSAADHAKFDRYYNGFTQATGGATQTVTLRNIRIGFVRPGDYTVTTDPRWQ